MDRRKDRQARRHEGGGFGPGEEPFRAGGAMPPRHQVRRHHGRLLGARRRESEDRTTKERKSYLDREMPRRGPGRGIPPRTREDGNRCAVPPRLGKLWRGPPLPKGFGGQRPCHPSVRSVSQLAFIKRETLYGDRFSN